MGGSNGIACYTNFRMLRLLVAWIAIVALPAAAQTGTVLVIPFVNQGETRSLDWIGESVSENIRQTLDEYGLLVVDRRDRGEAAERLGISDLPRLSRASVLKIAESLDSTAVITGEYTLIPDPAKESKGNLRVTVHILYPRELRAAADRQEGGPLEQLAALQNRVSWQVLRALEPDAAPALDEFSKTRPPVRLDALEQYIRGLLAERPADQLRFLTQAAKIDPRYTQPAYELGHLYFEQKDYAAASDWFRKVNRPSSSFFEATFFLGIARYRIGDFLGAEKAFSTVAQEVPLNEVFNNLGLAQMQRGQPQGVEQLKRAVEGDPADLDYRFNLGYALWRRGDYVAAAEQFRIVVTRDAKDVAAGMMLSRCARREGPQKSKKEEGLERLKTDYQERVYRQLKAVLTPEKK
jgi:Flp pilus assembly protein TadD/TolB-like protein